MQNPGSGSRHIYAVGLQLGKGNKKGAGQEERARPFRSSRLLKGLVFKAAESH